MSYHIDDKCFSLLDLQNRIEGSDLIPSRQILKSHIKSIVTMLNSIEILNLADLRVALKSKKQLSKLVINSGLNEEILILLKREVESYFPKPYQLQEFPTIEEITINSLANNGIATTRDVYETFPKDLTSFAKSTNIPSDKLKMIYSLSSLSRIQWTGPTFAQMLFDSGYTTPTLIAKSDPAVLQNDLSQINSDCKYFNGNIGFKDVKRLIDSAQYIYN